MILVTGASGELGRVLLPMARRQTKATGTTFSRAGDDTLTVDLTDFSAVDELFAAAAPEIVIHTAISDQSPGMKEAIPAAAEHIGRLAAHHGSRVVALSTDMVFDGESPPYSERSIPNPRSAYARAKLQMETILMGHVADLLIVRTSLIYDFRTDCRQLSWMEERISAGEKVTLFTDEIRHPVWAPDLARAILQVAHSDLRGVIHIAGPDPLSRMTYGTALLEALGYDPDVWVEPVQAAAIAPHRPRDLTLDQSLAHGLLDPFPRSVPEAIRAGL